jgi:hypothetical protein
MRSAVALALFAGAFLLAPGPAHAVPLALGDHAAISQELSGTVVVEVARRAHYKRYAYSKRRYNWTYYPYWRPYQYRYWKFYYPYGGPLF